MEKVKKFYIKKKVHDQFFKPFALQGPWYVINYFYDTNRPPKWSLIRTRRWTSSHAASWSL